MAGAERAIANGTANMAANIVFFMTFSSVGSRLGLMAIRLTLPLIMATLKLRRTGNRKVRLNRNRVKI